MATLILRPNADYQDNDWIPQGAGDNYVEVNEESADGDTTYIYLPFNKNSRCWMEAPNVDREGKGSINKVTIYVVMREVGTALGATTLLITGTESRGTPTGLTGSYQTLSTEYAINPKTSVAWTWDDIDEFRIGCWGSTSNIDDGRQARCTQVYVEVDYGYEHSLSSFVGITSSFLRLSKVSRVGSTKLGLISKRIKSIGKGVLTLAIGLVSERLRGFSELLKAQVGLSTNLTRLFTGIRSLSSVIGLTASKVFGLAHEMTAPLGLLFTFAFAKTFSRRLLPLTGLLSVAGRTASLARALSAVVGITPVTEGILTYLRELAVGVELVVSLSYVAAREWILAALLGLASSLSRAPSFVRRFIIAIGITPLVETLLREVVVVVSTVVSLSALVLRRASLRRVLTAFMRLGVVRDASLRILVVLRTLLFKPHVIPEEPSAEPEDVSKRRTLIFRR